MVAITVILAAVIASFVLTMGQEGTQTTPQASFDFNYNAISGSADQVTVTHDTGDPIIVTELFIAGEKIDFGGSPGVDDTENNQWNGSQTSGTYKGSDAVVAGDSVKVNVTDSDYKIDVVWRDGASSQSSTLGTDTGPDYQ
jgi:hypothetical protein